jgi:predicted lysophospholipase L1 biosynthesis ABC-type transport system permease subunit
MNWRAYLRSLAARFFHRSEVAAEMEEELRSHTQHRADDLERSGLDRAQAERQARIEFGARERFKEEWMLSITGIFGMAAYSVSKRLREFGIRVALGAQRSEVLQAALGRAVKLLAIGSATGLLLGVLATRVLALIVYQATPRDPIVLAGVVLTMALLGLLATWIPAKRALSVDPMMLLREE